MDDNAFTRRVIEHEGIDVQDLFPDKEPLLCGRCERLNLSKDDFGIEYKLSDLKIQSLVCDFCSLLSTCSEKLEIRGANTTVSVRRIGSELAIKDSQTKTETRVLSVCKHNGT